MTSSPPSSTVLALSEVEASYGPYRALFGVSLELPAGSALALLGANGAGKTTVARVASGLIRPDRGVVFVAGRDVTGWPAHRIARLGLAHVPEGRGVFATLSVEENLVLGLAARLGRRRLAAGLDAAYETFPLLAERRSQLAGTLSGGQQRILSLAKVLVARPPVLVADELSLGLSPAMAERVVDGLRQARALGTAVLVVEQHVDRALSLCDRAAVLAHGSIVWQGPASEAAAAATAALASAPTVPSEPAR